MTLSIRQRIITLVQTALQTVPTINSADVYLALDGDPLNIPSISIEDHGDSAGDSDTWSMRRTLNLLIACEVEGDGGDDVTQVYNKLYSDIIIALMSDTQWSSLAEDTDVGDLSVAPTLDAETRQVTFTLAVNISYSHRRNDPTVQ